MSTLPEISRPVLCVAGPTGAGKSRIALLLAERFNGVILNADSRQVYKDFPIITAQPSTGEQGRVPHELYGFLDTRESVSAGRWAELAVRTAQQVMERGCIPIFVGGTGLYLRALLDGMAEIPPVPDHVREKVLRCRRSQGLPALYAQAQRLDPICAERIHPNDSQRILRILEVHEATGKPLSWWQTHRHQPGVPWPVLRIGIGMDLADLTPLLAARIELMLDAGAIDEAKAARGRCDDPAAPGWSGIGCAELHGFLAGRLDATALRQIWLTNTRAYAKRQLTWFRADTRIEWFRPEEDAAVLARAAAFLHQAGWGKKGFLA